MDDQPNKSGENSSPDKSKYRMQRAELGPEWDELVDRSPQGTVFCSSAVLGTLIEVKPSIWYVLKGDQQVAGLCFVESADGRHAVENDFVVYSGILFDSRHPEKSEAQRLSEENRILTFCAEFLHDHYEEVFITLPPELIDIRPFLWVNYGEEGKHFHVDIRFTSYIPLNETPEAVLEMEPRFIALNQLRRRNIRQGRASGVTTSVSTDTDIFVDMYEKTFLRQNKPVDQTVLRQLKSVADSLIASGRGALYLSHTSDGNVGSAAVWGWDPRKAYYVFGASNPDLRSEQTGTLVIWDSLMDLRSKGVTQVDMEGINSPYRGQFKLSFGGGIVPYYHLKLQ